MLQHNIPAAILGLITCSIAANAQQPLTKEIVVEREVEPAERAANRPSFVSPAILSPTIKQQTLKHAEYSGTGELTRVFTPLTAAPWRDTLSVSRYRGYAAIGYLPAFNIGASAGYRIIDRKDTQLGAWLQYNGESYKMNSSLLPAAAGAYTDKVTLKQHTFNIAVDGSRTCSAGTLDVNGHYMMSSASQPWIAEDFDQTVTGAGLNLGWDATATGVNRWKVGAGINSFGYDKRAPERWLFNNDGYVPDAKAATELTFGFNGSYSRVSTHHSWGININLDFQHLNKTGTYEPLAIPSSLPDEYTAEVAYMSGEATTYGIYSIAPHYCLDRGSVHLRLGASVDLVTGGGKKAKLFASPDVTISFAPVSQFAAYITTTGGKMLNTLDNLYQLSPRQLGILTYVPSQVIDARFGLSGGPVSGVSAQAWVGYSQAKDWLVPTLLEDEASVFMPVELKGIYFGARLDWSFRNWFNVYGSVLLAPGKEDKGYYMNRDRARQVVEVGVDINPIQKLTVGASWQLRAHRQAYVVKAAAVNPLGLSYWDASSNISLGESNSVNVHATYSLTDAFSIFASVENILARRCFLTPLVQNAPIHGLVGVSLKF